MYNPVKEQRLHEQRRRKQPNSKDILKYSDIVRHNVGRAIPAAHERVRTQHGFTGSVFGGKDFVVRYEFIAPGNNSGFGVNPDKDRVIIVRTGSVYAMTDSNGTVETKKLVVGDVFNAGRGTVYSYATSGTTDAELLVIESVDYASTWQQQAAPTIGGADKIFAQPTEEPAAREPGASKAAVQATAIAEQKRRGPQRKAARFDSSNSPVTIGVNPRPMGPIVEGD